jgi:hypothetical protein
MYICGRLITLQRTMQVPGGVIIAERKLRIDAVEAVAIPHPRIRMHTSADESAKTALETNLAASVHETPPLEVSDADDEPVANDCANSTDESSSDLERAVRKKLISHPNVSFSSLTVRQIEGGACLDGVI